MFKFFQRRKGREQEQEQAPQIEQQQVEEPVVAQTAAQQPANQTPTLPPLYQPLPTSDSFLQPVQQPAQQPVYTPPVQQPVQQPVRQPVQQPIQQPVRQPAQQPVQQPQVAPQQQVVEQPAVEDPAVQAAIEREQREQERKINESLQATRRGFFGQIGNLFASDEISPDLWDDLQDLLVLGDCGVDTTNYVLDELEKQVTRLRIKRTSEAYTILKQILVNVLEAPLAKHKPIWADGQTMPQPYVMMIVGVNGAGKTTTIAKLTRYFQRFNLNVLLGAADTFRAAAIDQLQVWADRVDAPLIKHAMGADPGAVVYDSVAAAISRHSDILIIDTAGRLQNKTNLMEELRKMKRTSEKQLPGAPHDVLLVILRN